MRSLLVRLTCVVVNFLLGDTGPHVTAAQERDLAAARAGDPCVLRPGGSAGAEGGAGSESA